MPVSTTELTTAKAAAERLLEFLGLEAYLYEIEPGDDNAWTLILECPTDDGWQRTRWPVDRRELLRSADDGAALERLAAALSRHVAACRWVDGEPMQVGIHADNDVSG